MKVLVVYGTTEGHTRKIVERLAARMRGHDAEVEVHDSTALPQSLDIAQRDAVILAGSVHHGRHQAALIHFIKAHRDALNKKPTALVSVSFSAMEDDPADAQGYVNQLVEETDWQPSETFLVAGALLYTEYDFMKRWMIKLIMAQHGKPSDTTRDYEFTNWSAVDAFTDSFVEKTSG